MYYIILTIIILIILVFKINNYVIYKPIKPTKEEYENFIDSLKSYKVDNLMLKTADNRYINAMWINKDNNQNVILYSHGNYGWCGTVIKTNTVQGLLNYGSVILFDYAGYGISEGSVSEENTYNDIQTVYDYITIKNKIHPSKVILYGYSLGTGITTRLLSNCSINNIPKLAILDAPYISIRDVADDMIFGLRNLITINYSNKDNIQKIKDNKITTKIIILHSKDDEMINYRHGKFLSDEFNIDLFDMSGGHNNPDYKNHFDIIFKNNL